MSEKKRRQFTGVVASNKQQSTVIIKVDTIKTHPRYKKHYQSSKRYACDWRGDKLELGDKVIFEETRPLSKTKRWRVIKKV